MTNKNQFWKSYKNDKKLRVISHVFKQNDKAKAHGYGPNLKPQIGYQSALDC